MKHRRAFVLLAGALVPFAATSAQVSRIQGPAQSPILAGVTIPPGATLTVLSGQVPPPLDPAKPGETPDLYGDTQTQATAVLGKIDALLKAQGLGLKDVVKLTVFLVGDPKLGGKLDFKGFSAAYGKYFGTADQPNKSARSVVQVVALANPGFLVEIEAIAAK
jgi:enamine deaminase RidA (YjgF/YER057c/UK114 family)